MTSAYHCDKGCRVDAVRALAKDSMVPTNSHFRRTSGVVTHVQTTKVRGNGVRMTGDTTCVYLGVQGERAKVGVAICCRKGLVGICRNEGA